MQTRSPKPGPQSGKALKRRSLRALPGSQFAIRCSVPSTPTTIGPSASSLTAPPFTSSAVAAPPPSGTGGSAGVGAEWWPECRRKNRLGIKRQKGSISRHKVIAETVSWGWPRQGIRICWCMTLGPNTARPGRHNPILIGDILGHFQRFPHWRNTRKLLEKNVAQNVPQNKRWTVSK